MAKPRVHEIAAEMGVDSKTALRTLQEMGEFVKSASSSVEPPVARRLREALARTSGDAEEAKASGGRPAAPKPGPKATPAAKPGAPKPGAGAPKPGAGR
ncbi:MAG: translation initiation factor IF-2 N-terminal domain-containing protein, partial [Pseudoclavibacter sp.]|nr:translation initiation factor IF-2 N-terminal domain-containing protein [Pseudoclavibacter sp.]